MSAVIIKIADTIIKQDRTALKEMCHLRSWCYANVKNGWHSFYLDATDVACMNGVGFIAFEFNDPKEQMKFQLFAGGV